MSFESLVEMSVLVFDPAKKISVEMLFSDATEKLKNYPGDLSALFLKMYNHYSEAYYLGNIYANRYYSVVSDNHLLQQENQLLNKQLTAVKQNLM